MAAVTGDQWGFHEAYFSELRAAIDEMRASERQRVAMFSPIDWAYLIEAKRAPHFEFVPSHATFTRRQLTTATTGFDLIFTPRSAEKNHGIEHPELAAILIPLLDREFEIAAEGEALIAWKRKIR